MKLNSIILGDTALAWSPIELTFNPGGHDVDPLTWTHSGMFLTATESNRPWFHSGTPLVIEFTVDPEACARLPRKLNVVNSVEIWDNRAEQIISVNP